MKDFLLSHQVSENDIAIIFDGINNISYRKEIGKSDEERRTSLEVAIVQDADSKY